VGGRNFSFSENGEDNRILPQAELLASPPAPPPPLLLLLLWRGSRELRNRKSIPGTHLLALFCSVGLGRAFSARSTVFLSIFRTCAWRALEIHRLCAEKIAKNAFA